MLSLRRQVSRFIPEWDRDKFWSVICEETTVGAIVMHSHFHGDETPWSWSITMSTPASALISRHGREASRDDAMAAFRRAWDIYRPEIGDGWWQRHLEHCARLDSQGLRNQAGARLPAPETQKGPAPRERDRAKFREETPKEGSTPETAGPDRRGLTGSPIL